jgi:hypothetical protein
MPNVVGVGCVRVMLPILRRRHDEYDAQLHRWNRLHRGIHPDNGLQHGSMPGKYVLRNRRWRDRNLARAVFCCFVCESVIVRLWSTLSIYQSDGRG